VALHVNVELLRTVVTVVWFVAFIGLWLWAWSGRRARDYAAAAHLPLEQSADACSPLQDGSS
jgi:cytochrome c oxidase cbb3-type subunit IV